MPDQRSPLDCPGTVIGTDVKLSADWWNCPAAAANAHLFGLLLFFWQMEADRKGLLSYGVYQRLQWRRK